MFHSIVLKFKSTISSLFWRKQDKHETVGNVDKNKEPLRYDFEIATLVYYASGVSLAKYPGGKYIDPRVESSWWSWREVYSTDYNGEAEQLSQEQHKERFQKALLSSSYAANHSPSELLAVNNEERYSIDWVESAWDAWMQAIYMYKIQ